MKVVGVISATALFLLLGSAVPAFAQEEHHEEAAKPAQHEERAKPAKQEAEAKPAPRQQEAKPAKQQAEAKPAPRQQEAKPAKQEAQAKPAQREEHAGPAKQEAQAKPAQRQQQAKPVKQEEQNKATTNKQTQNKQVTQEQHGNNGGGQHAQRTPQEQERQRAVPALRLSARGSGRIPDDRFRSNFGHEHVFVINQPVIVGGYSRFQYGGYYFGFVQPWPVGWYYTDDVYVDYIGGEYFLFNPYYPGVRVGLNVVL